MLIVCGTLSAFNYGTLRTTSPFKDGPINAIAVPPGTQLPAYQITSTSSIEMGSGYAPGIIAPFSNGNPSYQNGSGSSNGDANNDGIPDDVPNLNDPNDDSEQSPIGESWIMLAFAAMAAVVIRLRKKQTA